MGYAALTVENKSTYRVLVRKKTGRKEALGKRKV
jgi:hypothetical protein